MKISLIYHYSLHPVEERIVTPTGRWKINTREKTGEKEYHLSLECSYHDFTTTGRLFGNKTIPIKKTEWIHENLLSIVVEDEFINECCK